jgi:hypothetical protein
MSLQDDIKLVESALVGSSMEDWPAPEPGDARYPAYQAFFRICDQMPSGSKSYSKWRAKRSKSAMEKLES